MTKLTRTGKRRGRRPKWLTSEHEAILADRRAPKRATSSGKAKDLERKKRIEQNMLLIASVLVDHREASVSRVDRAMRVAARLGSLPKSAKEAANFERRLRRSKSEGIDRIPPPGKP